MDWAEFDYPGISYALQNQFDSQFQTTQGFPDLSIDINITGVHRTELSHVDAYICIQPRTGLRVQLL